MERNVKCLIAFFLFSNVYFFINAQDGSDIKYVPFTKLDKSLIGKAVQLDFYNRSFRGAKLDTVDILLDKVPISFVEHRTDDGENNRFSSQYLDLSIQ